MRKKLFALLLLIISTNVVRCEDDYKTKAPKIHTKHEINNERLKSTPHGEKESIFWLNRGKRQIDDKNNQRYDYGIVNTIPNQKFSKDDKLDHDSPFWANRGRRDSSSTEISSDFDYPEYYRKYCDHCSDIVLGQKNLKNRRDDVILSPFWGTRGRRNSDEIEDVSQPIWGNRGRRQEQEPFWGNRGRRVEDSPFWGNRGRREDEPFWGNRGRREESEPFWGNRGKKQEQEPFWGNRGRRHENEPFWGNRGRREEEPFWGNRGRRNFLDSLNRDRKENLKESILKAISDVENDIENLSRLKRLNVDPNSFWANRGRESKLKLYFNGFAGSKTPIPKFGKNAKTTEPGTVLDNRMFVDEPNYILVERSSRSSAEEDPYYISRGKKYHYEYNEKTVRDRRGAIEEILKSVRNDPYSIARGKKNTNTNESNSTIHNKEEYVKAKELICSAIELVLMKNDNKIKREIIDNDRDRRTILKKLAAQLQMDPYFVSRGKKNENLRDQDYLVEFISNIADKCN